MRARRLEGSDPAVAVVFAAKLFAAGYVMSSIIVGPSTVLIDDLGRFVENGVTAAVVFGIAYYGGLRLFRLMRSGAAGAVEANDLPGAVRAAGLILVAAFIASVSM
jgi:hypothetical protein